jgi:hypothetical protein
MTFLRYHGRAFFGTHIVTLLSFLVGANVSYAQPYASAVILRSPSNQNITFDHFGWCISSLRDIKRPALSLVAVGAPQDSQAGNQGIVYLFRAENGEYIGLIRNPTPSTNGNFARALATWHNPVLDPFSNLLIGAPLQTPTGGPNAAGAAYIWSTDPNQPVRPIASPEPRFAGNFGDSLTSIPDLDGDGVMDIAVASYNRAVFVFSGATLTLLYTLHGPPQQTYSAVTSVLGVPDLDGDGHGDLIVNGIQPNFVLPLDAYSGATGQFLWRKLFPRLLSLGSMDDIDGDGVADIIVGCRLCELEGAPLFSGACWVVSGASGGILTSYRSPNPILDGWFGASVRSLPDLDADGVPDFAVGARGEGQTKTEDRTGLVYVISGESGQPLQTLASARPLYAGFFGEVLDVVPDCNGDGRPEVVVGASGENYGQPGRQAYVFLSCRVDYDADLVIDSGDFFAFLTDFFAGSRDYNMDGAVSSQDFFDFLAEFFEGCG